MENDLSAFSLITTPWLSVRFKDGTIGKLAPVDIANENVIDVVANRADLQGAAWQFLIGFLQTTLAPLDREEWHEVWEDGLDAADVQKALFPLAEYFVFGEQSPSFMQDYEPLTGDRVDISLLLPEAPGSQTTKLNKDHFIKRGVTRHFCHHCTALALFSLQLNAPSGGKGYRTGLRGGGPMTTLVDLQSIADASPVPLWRKLWVNVMPQQESGLPIPKKLDAEVFPWLAPTQTSEKNEITTPAQVNKLQAYWGMPRRIRLDFSSTEFGHCHLCGVQSDSLIRHMRVKNYGTNYTNWVHPLTPYRCPVKAGGESFSLKAQPGGLLWRDWLGLNWTVKNDNNEEYPALVAHLFAEYKPKDVVTGLWGFGYDFDNMKARCWYEHRFPLLHLDLNQRNALIPPLQDAARLASRNLSTLRTALKEAWFGNAKNARGDFSFIDIDFWHRTQPRFFKLVSELEHGGDLEKLMAHWQGYIWHFARNEFDTRAMTNPYESTDLGKIMRARKKYFSRNEDKQKAGSKRSGTQEAQ